MFLNFNFEPSHGRVIKTRGHCFKMRGRSFKGDLRDVFPHRGGMCCQKRKVESDTITMFKRHSDSTEVYGSNGGLV